MQKLIPMILERLYKFDAIRALKDRIRPLKHRIFGKNGIYRFVDEIYKTNKEDDVKMIFDIGASVGDTALLFLRTFKQATVLAFEPLPVSMMRLIRRTNIFSNRIHWFNNGFYNQRCFKSFNVTSYHDASSLLKLTGLQNKEIKEESTVNIELDTIDEFCKSNNIKKIDLCKIDVEGVELEVLEGGREMLINGIYNVIVEINNLRKGHKSDSHIKVFQLLHDCGFTFIGCETDYFFTKDPNVLALY